MIIIFQVYLFFLAVFLLTIYCLTSVTSAGRIKRLCETELGVITQCCLAKNVQNFMWRFPPWCSFKKKKNVQNFREQYLRNLALKINVKVGYTSFFFFCGEGRIYFDSTWLTWALSL